MAELPTLESLGLSHREVVDLGRMLSSRGTFGTDYERKSVAELCLYLEGRYGAAQIAKALKERFPQALSRYVVAESAADPAPRADLAPKPQATTPAERIAQALQELGVGAAPQVDEEMVRRIVDQALANRPPARIELIMPEREPVDVTGAHPLMPKVLALATAGLNVLMVGPPGCGKTYLASAMAKAIGAKHFGACSLTAGTSESALNGRLLPRSAGEFGWYGTPFTRVYAEGGVFLFDEIDAADPNMLLLVNSALSNGHFEVEARAVEGLETAIPRSPECLLVGAANTHLTGATSKFVGRGALDAATADRWYFVEMDYDARYEAALAGIEAPEAMPWKPAVATEAQVRAGARWVLDVREAVRAKGLSRIISTRALQKATIAMKVGVALEEMKRDLLAGWSADERAALGALAPKVLA